MSLDWSIVLRLSPPTRSSERRYGVRIVLKDSLADFFCNRAVPEQPSSNLLRCAHAQGSFSNNSEISEFGIIDLLTVYTLPGLLI